MHRLEHPVCCFSEGLCVCVCVCVCVCELSTQVDDRYTVEYCRMSFVELFVCIICACLEQTFKICLF